jgi:hypothetical protein
MYILASAFDEEHYDVFMYFIKCNIQAINLLIQFDNQ